MVLQQQQQEQGGRMKGNTVNDKGHHNHRPTHSASPPVRHVYPLHRATTGGIRVIGSSSGSSPGLNEHQQHKVAAAGTTTTASTTASHSLTHPHHSTHSLPRRLFCTPPSTSLPPILVSTTTVTTHHHPLDDELYHLLALVVRAYVSPWFSRITRDRAFLLEVLRVVSHVLRRLEGKLVEVGEVVEDEVSANDTRSSPDTEAQTWPQAQAQSQSTPHPVDKVGVLCVVLPRILLRHILDYRTARTRSRTAYSAGVVASFEHRHEQQQQQQQGRRHPQERGSAANATSATGAHGDNGSKPVKARDYEYPCTSFEASFHSLQPHVAIHGGPSNSSPLFTSSPRQRHHPSSGEAEPKSSTSKFTEEDCLAPHSQEKLPSYISADYLRVSVEGLLKELLPPHDYNAETERTVIREVILGIILPGVLVKCSQPWFIYGLVVKVGEGVLEGRRKQKGNSDGDLRQDPLSETGAAVPIGTNETGRTKRDRKGESVTTSKFHSSSAAAAAASPSTATFILQLAFDTFSWATLLFYHLMALVTSLSLLFTSAMTSPAITRRIKSRRRASKYLATPVLDLMFDLLEDQSGMTAGTLPSPSHVIAQLRWAAASSISMAGEWGDRLILYILYTYIFNEHATSSIIRTIESTLFPLPGGFPAASPPDPDEEEQDRIKERAYTVVKELLPESILPYLYPGVPTETIKGSLASSILDPFGNHYCNVHLLMFVLDALVAEICPEMVVGFAGQQGQP